MTGAPDCRAPKADASYANNPRPYQLISSRMREGSSDQNHVPKRFGLHDRPWPERAIFGTMRSMSASGLERKIDIDGYVERVGRLDAGTES